MPFGFFSEGEKRKERTQIKENKDKLDATLRILKQFVDVLVDTIEDGKYLQKRVKVIQIFMNTAEGIANQKFGIFLEDKYPY